MSDQLHTRAAFPPRKEPTLPTEKEALWPPTPLCTLCRRSSIGHSVGNLVITRIVLAALSTDIQTARQRSGIEPRTSRI